MHWVRRGAVLLTMLLAHAACAQPRHQPVAIHPQGFPARPSVVQDSLQDRLQGVVERPQAWIVVDVDTHQVLGALNPQLPIHPASITKLMTLEMLFALLDAHVVQTTTLIPITVDAAARPNTKLGLPAGASLPVEAAVLAMAVHSSNDIATATADYIGGTEAQFAQAMTERARQMGMTQTIFTTASGLPDPPNTSTVRDLAILGSELILTQPQDWHYLGVESWSYAGKDFHNTNPLLGLYPGLDGGKTGYIQASGFNLLASATRMGHRLLAVVVGAPSSMVAARRVAALLDAGFDRVAPPRLVSN